MRQQHAGSAISTVNHPIDIVSIIMVMQRRDVVILVGVLWGVEVRGAHQRVDNTARNMGHGGIAGGSKRCLD